jgi:hypothetical protein
LSTDDNGFSVAALIAVLRVLKDTIARAKRHGLHEKLPDELLQYLHKTLRIVSTAVAQSTDMEGFNKVTGYLLPILMSFELKSLLDRHVRSGMMAVFKIVFSFTQIVSTCPQVFLITFPDNFMAFLNLLNVFNFNLSFFGIECRYRLSMYDLLVIKTFLPLFAFAILASLSLILYCIKRYSLAEKSMSLLLLISYTIVPNVSTTIFSIFSCESFDNGQTSLLRADYSIDCKASDRSYYVSLALIMILVYPIGIPLCYFLLLYRVKRYLRPELQAPWKLKGKYKESVQLVIRDSFHHIEPYKFLYNSYRQV